MSLTDQIANLFSILRTPSTILRLRCFREEFKDDYKRRERVFYIESEMRLDSPEKYKKNCCAPDDIDVITSKPIWLYEFSTATELFEYVVSGMGAASQRKVFLQRSNHRKVSERLPGTEDA